MRPVLNGKPTRRALLQAGGGALAAHAQSRARTLYAYVGGYTTAQRNARGDGIHVYRVNPETGAWAHVQHVGDLVNPSFLAMGPDRRCLYSVHGDETYATSFSINRETGLLTLLNRAQTGGRNGVYAAVSPNGRLLTVANYGTGQIAVLPVRPDGSLLDAAQIVALPGQPGPNRVEQAGSHPHQVFFDPSGKFLLSPDKGLDRIFVFAFDAATGKLTPASPEGFVTARSGSGPRHGAFHPTLPVLWVLNELSSTVATYRWEPATGRLSPMQILPAIPSDFTGENTSSGIAVSPGGRFVYCSNRGHDSIATFAANPASGLLTAAGWTSSQGRTPRFIALDAAEGLLVAANEQSDTIVTFRADSSSGKLTPLGSPVRNTSPSTVAFSN
jgi:6-phosphogluconolactonase (cycloisomerase 2 family)